MILLNNKKNKQNILIFFILIILFYIFFNLLTININLNLDIFDIKSYIFILSYYFHEPKLNNYIDEMIKEKNNGTIIDAGAYIGDTTLFLAKKYKNLKIYAIEPSKENINFINKVKKNNNIQNLIPLNLLLSDKNDKYITDNINAPNAIYKKTTNKNNINTINSYTLDYLVDNNIINGNISILHYDVEGMEFEVLKGSYNTIKKYKPKIIVEMLGKHNDKNIKVHKFLKDLNYTYKMIDENCCLIDINNNKNCRNYIFTYKDY